MFILKNIKAYIEWSKLYGRDEGLMIIGLGVDFAHYFPHRKINIIKIRPTAYK